MLSEPYKLLLGGLAACGLAGVVWSHGADWWDRRRSEENAGGPKAPSSRSTRARTWLLELAVLLTIGGLGWYHAIDLHTSANPAWLPFGQDAHEYLAHTLDLVQPGAGSRSPYRYPLYPWLAAWACQLHGFPPYRGAMQVSLIAAALLPAAIYLLGRQLAPRGVAIAGAALVLHLPPLLRALGTPSDYGLCTLLQVLVLASGVAALASGGFWRYLAFGVTTALLMASTPKVLLLLLIASPLVLAAVAFALLRRQVRALAWLVAFFAPLVLVWGIFARARPELYSLEHALFKVQRETAMGMGLRIRPPEVGSWTAGTPDARQGHWRVGSLEAITHLPDTLRFLAQTPEGLMPFETRLESLENGLRDALRLARLEWLGLVLLGCLAAGSMAHPGTAAFPRLLAITLLGAVTVSQLQGSTRSMYQDRYLLPVLVTLPLLMLAGGAGIARLVSARDRRRLELSFLPLAGIALWMVTATEGPFGDRNARLEASRLVRTDPQAGAYRQLWQLRRQLEAGDGVVDLTDFHVGMAVLRGQVPVVTDAVRHYRNTAEVITPGVGWKRRFLLEICLENRDAAEAMQWQDFNARVRHDARFRRVLPCVLEDLSPGESITLRAARPEGTEQAP